MKKELAKLTPKDVTTMGHALRHRSLQEVISVSNGTIYANFGDSVPPPHRARFKDNYRLAMAIRAYYRSHERQLLAHRSFAALLCLMQRKLISQTKPIEHTLLETERAKVIDQKALGILQNVVSLQQKRSQELAE